MAGAAGAPVLHPPLELLLVEHALLHLLLLHLLRVELLRVGHRAHPLLGEPLRVVLVGADVGALLAELVGLRALLLEERLLLLGDADDISALCCCSRSRARSRCCSAYWPSSCLRTAFCSLRILSWMIWSARRRVSSIFFSVFRSSCSSRPSRLRSSSTSCSDRCRALRTLSMCEPVYGPRGERAATSRRGVADSVIIADCLDDNRRRRVADALSRASARALNSLGSHSNNAARLAQPRLAHLRGCRGDRHRTAFQLSSGLRAPTLRALQASQQAE